jgi:2-dehydropantoate 2-reductase
MRLLVVGAGSTGGYFGGRLAQAGRDVTFLVRPGRAEQLKAKGLHIVSPHGDVTLAPKLVTRDAIGAPYDAVLLTVKAYSLEGALKDIAPAVGPKTMIVPMLNGMRHLEAIAAAFGQDALVGGLCSIAAALDDQGRIIHLSQLHDLVYGEISGVRSDRIELLDAVMRNAGFDARLSSDIEQDMWNKWMMLATLAGVHMPDARQHRGYRRRTRRPRVCRAVFRRGCRGGDRTWSCSGRGFSCTNASAFDGGRLDAHFLHVQGSQEGESDRGRPDYWRSSDTR